MEKEVIRLKALYDTALKQMTQDSDSWLHFLKFHAQIHKYPFDQAILAYVQKPDAQMIATQRIWKGLGRFIKPHEKGIMVIKYIRGKQVKDVLYDVYQTSGKPIQRPDWKIHDNERDQIAEIFSGTAPSLSFDEMINHLAREKSLSVFSDYQQQLLKNVEYGYLRKMEQEILKFVTDSTQFMVHARSGLKQSDGQDFNFLKEIRKDRALIHPIGFLIQTATMETMKVIAEAKQNQTTERIEGNDKQYSVRNEQARTEGAEHSNEQQSGVRPSDREIRPDGLDAASEDGSDAVYDSSNGRNAAREDAQERRTSDRSDRQGHDETIGGESRAGDRGYVGENATHQPDQVPGRGNRPQRMDQQLNQNHESEPEPSQTSGSFILDQTTASSDNDQMSLFNDWDSIGEHSPQEVERISPAKVGDGEILISDQDVDSVLVRGSSVENGKFRISDFFATDPTGSAADDFLKHEYGIGGWGGPDALSVSFDSKGIKMTKGSLLNPHAERTLKWVETAGRIKWLIDSDRYLTPDERVALGSYRQEKENKASEKIVELVENIDEISNADEGVHVQNYHFDESDELYPSGEKSKYRNNVAAIRLLKELESEKRTANQEQQKVLARYVGWGGLAKVFSDQPGKWEKEQQELKVLLTDKEYREAMESTITAYYTDQEIVREMYKVLGNLGFKEGKILDPAMGTGNFFSVLPEEMADSKLTGIELDSITGRLAKQLYPLADVRVQGYEVTPIKDHEFDVVLGNIPFNNIQISDDRYEDHKFLIHDYFIAKSLDVVKPGGMIAVITSKGTMDKLNTNVREYMAARSDLLGAIRLPNTAFKAIAGTEVTSDILFLKKRDEVRDLATERPPWVDTAPLPNGIEVNQYFSEHPEMILGKMTFSGFYHGSRQTMCELEDGQELSSMLNDADSNIHGQFTAVKAPAVDQEEVQAAVEVREAPAGVKNFTFRIEDDRIYYIENGYLIPQEFNQTTTERIKGMCGIRDALRDVIEAQIRDVDERTLSRYQKGLNERYDEFVGKYGRLHDNVNRKAFFQDDQQPMLLAIENLTKQKTYEKADIFYKATIRPKIIKAKAESAKEALEMSLNNKINVDLDYMSKVYGKDPETIIKELEGLIYLNPEKYNGDGLKGWEFKDEYLSGNVHVKLQFAKVKAEEHPALFQKNVLALEDVQPPRLLPGDIHFRVGSSWIPKDYYEEFMYEVFETSYFNRDDICLNYSKFTNTWKVEGKHRESGSVKVNAVYGTGRKNAYELFEDALNLQGTTVRDPKPYLDDAGREQVRYVVNPKETMIARSKQQDIQHAFSNWLFKDQARSAHLIQLYNDTFNTIRPRVYDGSFLTFPDMNVEMELRPHQENVVARMMSTGRALLAHEVGAGKTAAMIAGGMKLKQIGAARKPMYVVMNHTIEQWANEFMRFYPGANILVATKKDFEKKNRQKFVSKIAMGEYDAVIIGHSQFEKIGLSKERQESMIRRDIQTLTFEIKETKKEQGNDWSVKQLVMFQKQLESRLKKLQNNGKKDDLLEFEALGVDALFVDEAHVYKNLFTFTKLKNVAGIGTSSSQRATDMKMKCEYIQEQNQGRGVVFATGTPITNSMSELHVMQRFLQPDDLQRAGLEYFDNWAGTFGEVVTSLEMTPEGSGFRMRSRFAKFHNLPELMNTFSLVADIQTADMLKLPTPELEEGKAQIIVSQISDFQKEKMDEFVERSEAIRSGDVNPSVDNMLKVTHEAKLMAIDPRLIDENAPIDENSKLSLCAQNVYAIWEDTQEDRLTQIIFCDSGTPKPDRFNAYDELKRQLMKKGIPGAEIAFIHDAKTDVQRETLFEKVRSGDVRVILGSTSKVGTGTNIQSKLVAAHHVDCPWRPSDLTQRDGRILRQGNTNEKVSIFRYVTKGTFDGYLWQIQEQKNRYISQVMTGKNISRSVDDLDETVLTAAEVKAIATDNPLLLEKMTLDNDINRLTLIKNRWLNERATMQKNMTKVYPKRMAGFQRNIQAIQSDLKTINDNPTKSFIIEIGDARYDDQKEAGIALNQFIQNHPFDKTGTMKVGRYKDLEVLVKRDVFGNRTVGLKGESWFEVKLLKSERSNIQRLVSLEDGYFDEINRLEKAILDMEQQIEQSKKQLDEPFAHEGELNELLKKQSELNLKMEFEQAIENQQEESQSHSSSNDRYHVATPALER